MHDPLMGRAAQSLVPKSIKLVAQMIDNMLADPDFVAVFK
jgi:hypothetical protein